MPDLGWSADSQLLVHLLDLFFDRVLEQDLVEISSPQLRQYCPLVDGQWVVIGQSFSQVNQELRLEIPHEVITSRDSMTNQTPSVVSLLKRPVLTKVST